MASIVPQNGQVATGGPVPQMPGMGGTSNGNVPVGTAPTPTNTVLPNTGVQANPYAAPVVNGMPSTIQNNGVNWNDGSFTAVGDMKDTYGAGTGVALGGVLQNMGTVNDSAIQATIANTNLEAGKQYANIQAQQAAAGITPNSSSAALAAGDFYSSVNSQLQSTIAGMEQHQQDSLINTLTHTGDSHGPDETGLQSAMDVMSPILGMVGGAAGAISEGFGVGGTAGTILDVLGALAL